MRFVTEDGQKTMYGSFLACREFFEVLRLPILQLEPQFHILADTVTTLGGLMIVIRCCPAAINSSRLFALFVMYDLWLPVSMTIRTLKEVDGQSGLYAVALAV